MRLDSQRLPLEKEATPIQSMSHVFTCMGRITCGGSRKHLVVGIAWRRNHPQLASVCHPADSRSRSVGICVPSRAVVCAALAAVMPGGSLSQLSGIVVVLLCDGGGPWHCSVTDLGRVRISPIVAMGASKWLWLVPWRCLRLHDPRCDQRNLVSHDAQTSVFYGVTALAYGALTAAALQVMPYAVSTAKGEGNASNA